MLDFYGPELDIHALVMGLQDKSPRKVDRIRDFIDNFLEVRVGKLPVGKLPFKVRALSARDEMRENSQLAVKSFSAAVSSAKRGRVLSAAFHSTKFLTEASAVAMSGMMLTKRERKIGMLLGLELAAVSAFGGKVNAMVDPGEFHDAINSAKQTNIEERMSTSPRTPLEITIKTQQTLRKDFEGAGAWKKNDYLLSPYLVKKLDEDKTARHYMKLILKEAKKNDLNPVLFANQMFRESVHFSPTYIFGPDSSPAGALGLAQITPAKGKEYGLRKKEDFFVPQKSITAAAHIMHDLTQNYNGDQILAMAAYNGGKASVQFVRDEMGRNDITGQDWLEFMTKRFETMGNTNGSAWHMETRMYIGDITNKNWENTYRSWAQKLQGPSPMQYVATLDTIKSPGQQAIQNAIK